ncbi:hypothetical protein SDC9_116230 [bioreactor metagenome]|uniref:Uncharacterized protein n=1 Tax=bioreactor metagenome TaxID=1076179 RepID=A0A645BV02_9ZZZZ
MHVKPIYPTDFKTYDDAVKNGLWRNRGWTSQYTSYRRNTYEALVKCKYLLSFNNLDGSPG